MVAKRHKRLADFNNWARNDDCRLQPIGDGVWEGVFHGDMLHHLDCYGLFVQWNGGEGFRLPSAATRVVRHQSGLSQYGVAFNAQVWDPPAPYVWKNTSPRAVSPLIYETHVGMAQEKDAIGTFREFKELTLPRIADAGYNTVQLMAVQEHPFYGSFGYHVSNFFSVCDLFGTPDELKELIDTAHGLGLRVIMDFVQSHSVKNEIEGLGVSGWRNIIWTVSASTASPPCSTATMASTMSSLATTIIFPTTSMAMP